MDPELKAALETLATKDDLGALTSKLDALETKVDHLATKKDLRELQRQVWDLAGDVTRADEKIDRLRDDVRSAGVPL